MTKKEDNKPAGDPKRPYATLELKATEVKSEAQKDAATKPGTADPKAAAKPGDTKPAETKPPEAKPADPKATAPKPGDAKIADSKAADPKAADAKGAKPTASPVPPTAAKAPTESASKAMPPPARSSGGFGRFVSHAIAGLIGGGIVLAGADHIKPMLGVSTPPPVAADVTDALAKRLAALERTTATPPAIPASVTEKLADAERRLARLDEIARTVAGLGERQGQLSTETKALNEKIKAQTASGSDAERLAKLEATLAVLTSAADADPNRAGRIPQLAALAGKVTDLETALANRIAALRRDLSQEIDGRVGQVAESSEAAKAGAGRLDREIVGIKTDAARLNQRVEAIKATGDRLEQMLRIVQEEAGKVRSALDGLKGDLEGQIKTAAKPADIQTAITPVVAKVTALETSLQGVVKSEADRRVNAERIVLSLELANLKRAMDRGQPFGPELAEVKKSAGTRLQLGPLEPFATKGVATIADLQREFRQVANAVIDADTVKPEGSILENILSGAGTIVRVRKTNPAPDDKSTEAVVSRMELALKDGRLADVIAEAKTLPAKAATPAAAWLKKVEARLTVDRALTAIESDLKSSLAGGPAPTR